MRSRWFHTPVLHLASSKEKRASWLELFYDLIFVAAFIQLGNGLSSNVSASGMAGFAAVFIPLWLAWTGLTFYVNRFNVDDFIHRILVILQMFAVGAMATFAPDVIAGEPRGFALSYAVAQAIVAILYARTLLQCSGARDYSRYWGLVFGLGAVIWTISAFVPPPWCFVVQGVGVIAILSAPFSRTSRSLNESYPWDQEHLSERYGLLTLIVLGESFVKVLATMGGGSGELSLLGQASLSLLITVCVWWIYFDDVAGSHLRKIRLAPFIWLFAHMPLQGAAVGVGVAIKKAVSFDLTAVPDAKYRWLLCGSLALALLSVSVIDSVTERKQADLSDRSRVNMRFASALLILLLAPAGGGMTGALFLTLVTVVCVAQVIFDLMMAPLEAMSEAELSEFPTTASLARARQEAGQAPEPLPPRFLNAVRAGTPSELRSDLYHYFIDGPWSRLLVAMSFLYLIGNVLFAALYQLNPGSIVGAQTFGDAFFFSVQTMSTIGYGAMNPGSAWGNAIVTIEAAFSLASIAMATGVMFAKASRPRASVLFSEKLVITRRNGVPTLCFRMGNARGSEIVDAHISVSILVEEITPEGHHLRRLQDLKMVRNRTPVFFLTWAVMHEIDETSPLYGADLNDPSSYILGIVALFTGHDGSYGQTTYARHIYEAQNVYPWHRFVDVLSQLPDGRALVNYRLFHDVVADEG